MSSKSMLITVVKKGTGKLRVSQVNASDLDSAKANGWREPQDGDIIHGHRVTKIIEEKKEEEE